MTVGWYSPPPVEPVETIRSEGPRNPGDRGLGSPVEPVETIRIEGWEPTLRVISTGSMSGVRPSLGVRVSRQALRAFLNHRWLSSSR